MNFKVKIFFVSILTISMVFFNCEPVFALNANTTSIERQFDKSFKSVTNILNLKNKLVGRFSKNNELTDKEVLEFYLKYMIIPYTGVTDDSENLATVITNLLEEDWSIDAIKVLTKQLYKALVYTTSGIPTQKDIEELGTELKSGEYYYPDLPGNEVMYSSIKDIVRFCNFSTMFNSAYTSTGNLEIVEGIENPNPDGKPISIGKLTEFSRINPETGEEEKLNDVWLVGLAGTSFIENQSSGLIADILSGCEANSPYLQSTLEAITATIPKGSKIMLTGFSLGGMMAQQVMVQDVILENYDIIQVTVVGCPPLCVDEREKMFEKYDVKFPINRVIDKYDLIPFLCTDYLRGKIDPTSDDIDENLLIGEANPRYKTFVGTHFLGYLKDKCWDNYDALGYKVVDESYRASIKLDLANFQFFDAPTEYLSGDLSKYE